MGASASVQGHGRPWWGSTHEVKAALEGGKWRQQVEQHVAEVDAADPHTGRTLLHEVLRAGHKEAAAFLVGCGAASVADGEGRTPVWYALQHHDKGTRSALLAALGEQVKEMQKRVASRLQDFLTDEWPRLKERVAPAAAAAAHIAPQAPQQRKSQTQSPAQDLCTQKPTDKDKTSERLQNHVDGRKICFTRSDKAGETETPLLEWLVQLLAVQPDLGYRAKHIDSMLLGLRFVVQRVLQRVEATPDEIEDWMAVDDWFEHLCAGYLFTCDCVEYQTDGATGDLVCTAEGVPIIGKDDYHEDITDKEVLTNHGAKYMRPALYFGMNHAMRTIGLSKEARESAARSVFELEPAPAQLHVVETFQPLMTKLTRLIRSRRPSLTTVFRGINVNVSAQYKVGTSVVWNAFTSTTREQDVAKTFMYGKAGTFFVIVAKQGAAEVGFASVFPQEAELLYDSNIEFRVQWKLSPTLLRMVGQPFDVIVMQEVARHDDPSTAVPSQLQSASESVSQTQAHAHPQSQSGVTGAGTAYDVADQVEAVRQVLQHTASLFAEFLDSYVEGRVGDDPRVPEAETRMLLHEVEKWLAADGHGEEGAGAGAGETGRHPLCLVGDGGTGKTSAAVAVLCHLLQEKEESQRKKPVFPVFAALPAIGVSAVTTHGGIDEFIQKSFGLDGAALDHLSSAYDVVVILDSLDEVGLTQKDLGDAYKASGGQGVLRLHPWCAKHCSVIVTTRGEYLKSVNHTASQVCGDGTRSLYMQPFTQGDAMTYISKVRAKADQHRVDVCFTADEQRQLAATVDETCGAAGTTVPGSDRALVVAIAEQAWVLAGGGSGRRGSACSSDSRGEAPQAATAAAEEQDGDFAGNAVRGNETNGCVQVAADAVMLALEGRGGGTPHAVLLRDVVVALSQQAGFLERRKAALRHLSKSTTLLEQLAVAEPVPPHTVAAEVAVLSQLRNPFLLHMACYAQGELSSCSTQAQQRLSDVAVYEAYLHRHVEVELRQLRQERATAARVEEVLQVGELIACAMLQAQTWQGVLGAERVRLLTEESVDRAEADEAFRVLPFRVESFEDDSSAFTFRHKTLGEFLVARRLARVGCVSDTLRCKVRRPFSQDAPNVVQFFADTVLARGGEARDTKVTPELLPLVMATRDAGADAISLAAASNAMALATRTRFPFRCDLSDVIVQDSDLRNAFLCGTVLKRTRFHNCWLEHALLTDLNVTDSDWKGCSFGAPLPPLLGHTSFVSSVTVTPDGSNIISGSGDNTVRVWDTSTGKELQKLEGHTSFVSSVTVTPDGSNIISGSDDNTVRVWDTSTGKELQKLEGHTSSVNSVTVTPDGSNIISGSDDNTVRVWDTSTGKELQKLEGHTSSVYSVTVTPDGSNIISGSEDNTVRVWDTSTGKELQKLEGHMFRVYSVAVTPDGSNIISGSDDNTVRVWDTSTGKELQKLEGHTSRVFSVTVTPDGSNIISGSHDNSVRVWGTSTGKELQKLEGHTSSVHSVTVTPDGSNIISGSHDNTVRVWDTSTGKELQKLEGHTSRVFSVTVTPDGSNIISGSHDNSVRVWGTSTGKELQKLEGHTDDVISVAVTPDGSNIISGSDDNTVRVWDTSTGKELQKLEGHMFHVYSVAVTPDGSNIISGAGDETVRVWDTSTGKELQKLEGHTSPVYSVAVAPDGSNIISGSGDKSIRVWDTSTGKELQKLEGHTSPVYSVTVTPDGSNIISGSYDNTVRVWDTSTGKELKKLEGHTSYVNSVTVTPDGSNIISGSDDNTVRVWDTSTGKELQKLEGHTSTVYSVAVTPDGSNIISGSSDNTVRVWDTSTGKELQKLEGHTSRVSSVAVAPDGSNIISGSGDNSVRVWDTSTGKELPGRDGRTPPVDGGAVSYSVAVCDKMIRMCAAWHLRTVIGPVPFVPASSRCTGLDTVTPLAVRGVLRYYAID